jgi:hypothetical protein
MPGVDHLMPGLTLRQVSMQSVDPVDAGTSYQELMSSYRFWNRWSMLTYDAPVEDNMHFIAHKHQSEPGIDDHSC